MIVQNSNGIGVPGLGSRDLATAFCFSLNPQLSFPAISRVEHTVSDTCGSLLAQGNVGTRVLTMDLPFIQSLLFHNFGSFLKEMCLALPPPEPSKYHSPLPVSLHLTCLPSYTDSTFQTCPCFSISTATTLQPVSHNHVLPWGLLAHNSPSTAQGSFYLPLLLNLPFPALGVDLISPCLLLPNALLQLLVSPH